ncbi:MAG: glycosyltransferase family 39 protein [Bacteroidetes bacterium]|nr:glycosyltransferase family 39 protein [Bacteroidota bacterium]
MLKNMSAISVKRVIFICGNGAKMRESNMLGRIKKRLPALFAVLGGILYLAQAIYYAQVSLPNLDEGSYLYKGYLFAEGAYRPFQEYGFWVNKMPLSFLLWGWVLKLFGPTLLTARAFAVLLSILALLGTWIVARRFTNGWLATLVVWALSLNASWLGLYSIANSQVLVHFMITWVLVFCIGPNRPAWQLAIGSALAGMMVMTRENTIFFLPPLFVYLFWENGKKKALLALFSLSAVIAAVHAVYWPGIFSLWARWLPDALRPFDQRLDDSEFFRSVGASSISLDSRLHSLSLGIRAFFIPLAGSLFSLVYWPRRSDWPSPSHFRASVFLAVSFWVLTFAHAWASIGKNYCLYCFPSYMGFFAVIGLLQVVLVVPILAKDNRRWTKYITWILIPLITSALGFSLFQEIGAALLQMPMPRVSGGVLLPEWTTLRVILANGFDMSFSEARKLVPTLAGLGGGILLALLFGMIARFSSRLRYLGPGLFSVYGFLLAGFAFLPFYHTLPADTLCATNAIVTYDQQIGSRLSAFTRPDDKVYLDGARTAILMLYISDAEVLPPQLNGDNSLRVGGDPEALLKRGYWNEEVGLSWRETADVFILGNYSTWAFYDYFNDGQFEQLTLQEDVLQCSDAVQYFIYRRK